MTDRYNTYTEVLQCKPGAAARLVWRWSCYCHQVAARPSTDSRSSCSGRSSSHWLAGRRSGSTPGRRSSNAVSRSYWRTAACSNRRRGSFVLPGTHADTPAMMSEAWGRPGTCGCWRSAGTDQDNLCIHHTAFKTIHALLCSCSTYYILFTNTDMTSSSSSSSSSIYWRRSSTASYHN